MKEFLVIAVVLSLTVSGCMGSRAITNEPAKPSFPSAHEEGNSSLMFTRWTLADKTPVEARVDAMNASAPQSKSSPSAYRLLIRNTGNNATVFEQTTKDRPISMYTRDLNDDWNQELILRWAGGSADRIEILSVSSHAANAILNESYRVDAALLDLSGRGKIDVLITTGESGAGPLYVTRYAWQSEKYTAVGRMRYDVFVRTITRLAVQ
jgi:hypothetical protein